MENVQTPPDIFKEPTTMRTLTGARRQEAAERLLNSYAKELSNIDRVLNLNVVCERLGETANRLRDAADWSQGDEQAEIIRNAQRVERLLSMAEAMHNCIEAYRRA